MLCKFPYMGHFVVNKYVRIKADPSTVWDALTNPSKTQKYFFNCKVYSNWKQGDTITFKGRMFFFIPIVMKGVIQQVIPGKLLKYTLKNGKGENGSVSTVTDVLSYENGDTIVSITDDVGDGDGAEKRFSRSQKGWDKILSGLKNFVEAHR